MSAERTISIRVMVVDDQSVMRKIISGLLFNGQIDDVIEAENGRDALKILSASRDCRPDVIISDIFMDKMDGIDFIHHLRRMEGVYFKNVPILVLTGELNELVHEVSEQVGALKVLTKPISAESLCKEVYAAFVQVNRQEASQTAPDQTPSKPEFPSNIVRRLKELKRIYYANLVTKQEYEDKRKEIVDEL